MLPEKSVKNNTESESLRRHRAMYERRLRELARMAEDETSDYSSEALIAESPEADLATV